MLKIKTFSFEDNSIFKYNSDEEEKYYREPNGEYYYIRNIELIDKTINDFIGNNNIDVIDIKINNIVKNNIVEGNKTPISILIYTITYYEESEE